MWLLNLLLLPVVIILLIVFEGTVVDIVNAASLTGIIHTLAISALPGTLISGFLIGFLLK